MFTALSPFDFSSVQQRAVFRRCAARFTVISVFQTDFTAFDARFERFGLCMRHELHAFFRQRICHRRAIKLDQFIPKCAADRGVFKPFQVFSGRFWAIFEERDQTDFGLRDDHRHHPRLTSWKISAASVSGCASIFFQMRPIRFEIAT